ncbi:lipase [Rickenella mellea]|uniref:Lipase n=1 Tax=Rickenella mellea TaxID=50990 RepID=A0A4Y7QEN1_9AGAM|nr:lipase [Rickenella mellea]
MTFLSLGLAVLYASVVYAAPTQLLERASVTPLSAAQISTFKPYTFFASAAYCQPSATLAWNCGANCQANAGFQPQASGGDGSTTQFWYVGYSPGLNTVVVAHQGTDTVPILTDVDFFLAPLDATLFPGLSSSIEVHNGFRDTHARSAPGVLAAVQKTLAAHSGASVTIVGHSLGAAIALLDTVYLPLHLPAGTTFKTVGYGMPRVGNQAFADYVDAHATQLTHITNKHDPVPILPGRGLGFHHPSGEVHIDEQTSLWEACPGQDNTSDLCTVGDVPNIFVSSLGDHTGPYDGVTIGC